MFVFPDSFFPIRQVTSGSMTNSPESATDRKCVTRALTSCNRPPERRWGWSAPRAARQEHEDRRDPGTAQAHPGVCPELDLQDRRCPASSTHHLEAYCECSVTHREHQENVLDRRIGKRAEAAEDTLPVLHPLEPSLHRHLGRSAGPRPHAGTASASPRAAQSGTGATPRPVAGPPRPAHGAGPDEGDHSWGHTTVLCQRPGRALAVTSPSALRTERAVSAAGPRPAR